MAGHKILLKEKNLETVKNKYYNFGGFAFLASYVRPTKLFTIVEGCTQCSFS